MAGRFDLPCHLLGVGQLKKPSFYGIGKSILANAITVHDWWTKQGFDRRELIHAFVLTQGRRQIHRLDETLVQQTIK
jgi:hypothetical protein